MEHLQEVYLRQLLEKHREGTLLPEEEKILDQWFAALPSTDSNWYKDRADEAAQLASVWQSIYEKTAPPVVSIHRRKKVARYWWAAAAVAGIIGLCWWSIPAGKQELAVVPTVPAKQEATAPPVHLLTVDASRQTVRKVELPDHSIVLLNSGASIQYPEHFNGAERSVTLLKGQAFFEVRKDPMHPFVVHSDGLETRVLGTSFEVAIRAKKQVMVSVATGKVGVRQSQRGELGRLVPGMRLTWQEQTGKVNISDFSIASIASWRQRQVQLEQASFAQLAEALETIYGVHLQTTDSLVRQQTYTIQLRYDTALKHMLEVLAAIHDNTYSIHQNTVIVKPRDP